MREETRYRVTGSIFLLALAVICLPMLLDGAGLPARHLPDLPMQEALPDIRPLSGRPPESDFVARVEQLREQVDDEGFLTDSGTRFGEPVLKAPGLTAGASDAGKLGDDEAVAPGGASAQTPSLNRGSTPAWAVQVASFAEAGNAEDFRARLRRDGYEAFISTAKADERVLSRVAVGPLLDRERAESLRSELSARYEVQAQLMAFSN